MPKYDVRVNFHGNELYVSNATKVIRTGDLPYGHEVVTTENFEGRVVYVNEGAQLLVVEAHES